ncbi:hypothetical protein MYD03_00605, partial [Mediterraneibacter gnavus]
MLLEEEKDKEIIPKWKNANGSLVDFCRLRPLKNPNLSSKKSFNYKQQLERFGFYLSLDTRGNPNVWISTTRHFTVMEQNIRSAPSMTRYLIGSEQNEPQLEWNKEMHGLFQEMLHYR